MERKREFDIARGFAAYLVVLGHLLEQGAQKDIFLITFCHMPVFFWISGYFMRLGPDGAKEQIVKKTKRLFIPYIIWSGVSFAANVSPGLLGGRMGLGAVIDEFLDIFIYSRSVWFLIMLFAAEMLGMCAALLASKTKISVYPIMLAMWLALGLIPNDTLFCIYKLKWLFPFFILGVMSNRLRLYERADKRLLAIIGAVFPFLAIFSYSERLFSKYIICSYTMAENVFTGLWYYFVSALSICLVIGASAILKNFKFVKAAETAGRYTMEIYVIHMFFLKLAPNLPGIKAASGAIVYSVSCVYSAAITAAVVILSKFILERFRIFRFSVGKA